MMNDYLKKMNAESDKKFHDTMKKYDRAEKALNEINKIMTDFGKEVDEFLGKK